MGTTKLAGKGSSKRGPMLLGGLLLVLGLLGARFVWLRGHERAAEPVAPMETAAAAPDALAAPATEQPAAARAPALPAALGSVEPAANLPAYSLRGRVLDSARRPFAGATVELVAWGARSSAVRSAADGTYELHAGIPPDLESLHVLAYDGAGNAGRSHSVWPQREESIDELAVQPIVLLPAHALDVHVVEHGMGVPDARVRAVLGGGVDGRAFELASSPDGRARLEHLPAGALLVTARTTSGEGRARAFVPREPEVRLELLPTRDLQVQVIDAQSREGIAGATVVLSEMHAVMAPGLEDGSGVELGRLAEEFHQIVPAEPVRADARGVVVLHSLHARGEYQLSATAEGYPSVERPGGARIKIPKDVSAFVVELSRSASRAVRWPVVAGEVPPPADGTEILLRWAPGTTAFREERPPLRPARMEGAFLVAPEISAGGRLIGEAPDGSLAVLYIADKAELGTEISFRHPRQVEVLVHDSKGANVQGASVVALSQGNNELAPPQRTDGEGRAVLKGLHGELASVHVAAPGRPGFGAVAGTVDLEQGDGRIEHTLPPALRATLALRIDGAPRLPSFFSIHGRGTTRVIGEDAEKGELELEIDAAPAGSAFQVSVRAEGFLPATVDIAFPPDGSPGRGEHALQRAGVLIAEVDAGGQPVEIMPERFDETAQAWQISRSLRALSGRRQANGPHGSFVFPNAEPGRWRIVERSSKLVSEEGELLPGQAELRLRLQIAAPQWVSGRVEAPDPAELVRAVVVVEGAHLERDAWSLRDGMPGSEPPKGTAVASDGTFRVRIPGGRPVRIVAWHPWLAPEAGSTLEVTEGREGALLRLVAGDELRVTMPATWASQRSKGVRIARFAGEARGEPAQWHHAPVADGVARCGLPRGRWTLWLDEGGQFAPLVLEDVSVEGVTTLAPQFERGSCVRFEIQVPEGQDPPRIFASASRQDGPPVYMRQLNSRGEREVVLGGLGAGRFEVRAGLIGGEKQQWTFELDGVRDQVLDLRP